MIYEPATTTILVRDFSARKRSNRGLDRISVSGHLAVIAVLQRILLCPPVGKVVTLYIIVAEQIAQSVSGKDNALI